MGPLLLTRTGLICLTLNHSTLATPYAGKIIARTHSGAPISTEGGVSFNILGVYTDIKPLGNEHPRNGDKVHAVQDLLGDGNSADYLSNLNDLCE